MARAPRNEEALPPNVRRQPLQVCAFCAHWRQRPNNPYFGECALSFQGGQSMLIMPDRGSCGGWTGTEHAAD